MTTPRGAAYAYEEDRVADWAIGCYYIRSNCVSVPSQNCGCAISSLAQKEVVNSERQTELGK